MAQRDRERGDRCGRDRALDDLRGTPDARGSRDAPTVIAVADELASAADLAGGKVRQRPVVVVRGATFQRPVGADPGAAALVMPREQDLFP